MDAARREALRNRARLADADLFQANKARLDLARRSILARGFCVSDGETQPGYQAVSTPMRVAAHEEPIAFNCAVPTYQLRKGEVEQGIGPKLVAMVRTLEHQFGVRRSAAPERHGPGRRRCGGANGRALTAP